jgi:hypothetical protein
MWILSALCAASADLLKGADARHDAVMVDDMITGRITHCAGRTMVCVEARRIV